MKKIISIITVMAVMLTMLAVVPASAAVNAKIAEGYNLGTENGGLFGKAADEYAVKWTTPDSDTKSPLKVYEANYNFSDSKYTVLDLNVAPLDGAVYFSAGPNAGIYSITNVKAFNKNEWNSVRVVLEEQTKEQMASTGKYQPMTMYVNGVKVGEGADALNANDELTGNGTAQYGKGFRFSVHGNKATDVAYVADVRLSESDVNEAPVLPSLDASDKYSIEKYGILINTGATVADLTAGSNTVKVYKGGELVTDTSALLTEDCEVIVCDNVNKLYKYYNVGVLTVNEWNDDNGNTYTWSYSPITATLTIGMVDTPTVASGTTYGALNTESWAGGGSARPWYGYRDQIEHVAFSETGNYHFQCLGREMFGNFTKMKEVVIPRYVKDAQWGVFNNSTGLETAIFEEGGHGMEGGFTSLKGMKMFAGCTNLSKVVLSSGFTNLNGGQFFYGCTSLKELFVPASVATISGGMFDKCGDVKLITYENSTAAARIAATTFTGASSVTIELIPAEGLIEDAQGNEGSISWKIDAATQTLTVSDVANVGTGDMPDKAGDNYQGMFPWNHISGYNKVVVEDGITRTGRWFLMSPKSGTQQSVSIPGTLKAGSVFSFVGLTVNDLIFNEGAEGIFSVDHCINRDCKITNMYLPSTAKNIQTKFWRAFNGGDTEGYLGLSEVNLYAPLGSDAYKWSTYRAAYPRDGVTVNALANITVKSFADENVVVANNGFSAQTADVIVAYFDGDTLKDVVISKDVALGADTDVNIDAPASAQGYKRTVFVWNDMSNLAPVAINVGE